MLHFSPEEFEGRKARLMARMAEEKLDALMLFAQESMYWLTGYDTFGFCFFQCLVVKSDGEMRLLTRSADLRQARNTSNVETVVVWRDRSGADPLIELRDMLDDMDLLGAKIGVEWATHGLTAANGKALEERLGSFASLRDASYLVSTLRSVKSPAEITYVREAARLADDAYEIARPLIKSGADEGEILAAMQSEILRQGGDYPANPFVIGSGPDALLCRYKSGRTRLKENDQLTLEWAGVKAQYHAALIRTFILGSPSDRHLELHAAAVEALAAMEKVMRPGSSFGDVFDAYAGVMENHELVRHRLSACGYSLGARYAPTWMDTPMFYAGNPAEILPNMTLFAHVIIMDSGTETAMTLGRTYLTPSGAPEPFSKLPLDLDLLG